jgi:hypothetical protein
MKKPKLPRVPPCSEAGAKLRPKRPRPPSSRSSTIWLIMSMASLSAQRLTIPRPRQRLKRQTMRARSFPFSRKRTSLLNGKRIRPCCAQRGGARLTKPPR